MLSFAVAHFAEQNAYMFHIFQGNYLIKNILKYSKNRLLTYSYCVYPLFFVI